MPSKYVVRNFGSGGFYHIYNRGVEKRDIFLDEQDYRMFLYYLFVYLSQPDRVIDKYPQLPFKLRAKNLSNELELLCFSLMPNHFHLLLRQSNKDSISRLLKQVTNAYTLYFNRKYKRVGGLMQGRFKAVEIKSEEQLLHLSRYIHLNAVVAGLVENIRDYQWSSYNDYSSNGTSFCTMSYILTQRTPQQYEKFVLDHVDYAKTLEHIKHALIEE